MTALSINAQTKIGELLDAYPQLEETLLELSPTFAKLKNPILRRTVARIATLEQAARMAGLSPQNLVARLREAAGPPSGAVEIAADGAATAAQPAPGWIVAGRVVETIDADTMLESGEHPLGHLARGADKLGPGELICVQSSFRPVPLVETLAQRGVEGCITDKGGGRFATYFRSLRAGSS